MRFFACGLVLACAFTGTAHAGHDPARQVLPAGDGWASAGPGTTGGSAATTVHEVRTRAELIAALAAPAPRIIKVRGVIDANTAPDGTPLRCTDYATGGYSLEGYLAAYDPATWGWQREPEGPLEEARKASAKKQEATIALNVGDDTTVIGVGEGAGINGGSLRIHGSRNVIVRNLTFRDTHDCFPRWDPTDTSPGASPGNWNSLYDSISIQRSEHVWVDRSTFTDAPNPDSRQPLHFGRPYQVHDGQLDITNGADLVTVSRNRFEEHGKTMLIGSSNTSTTDPGKLRVSVHHNVFRNVLERAPRVRFGQVHVYNNLYEGAQSYSWGVGVHSRIFAQNNYVKGIAAEKVVYNWGGTAITDRGNLLNGRPHSFVHAHNAANPDKQLATDAGWTPTLDRGLEPAHRIRHLKAGA
ncbi:polysaccharide lyase family 1 protein [Lentzea sp. NBRC 102530]|uniref:pectate lyase family protein n=1 Tax=Lentzea sp. NBRC 102530 TaxID=3032201 RepID=UPI0024A2742C|nr:polysaccharide lyase family 1 protein [Lentzea sp. NBRC 102530]GLY47068.1 pectate lyase [Lentzea sp. NBRC 102530]